MTVALVPSPPAPAVPTQLTTRLTHTRSGEPLRDLMVLHERVVHNFIVNLDFSSFAHIHHEDFAALEPKDLAAAELRFPYTFPRAGNYRMVSEFTHKERSWTKHFDVAVGDAPAPQVKVNLLREKRFGPYHATLTSSPTSIVAGFETELVLTLGRGTEPVTDLQLILGSEVHLAAWRIDGQQFGHSHSYTPHMASMFAAMHDRNQDAPARAQSMRTMMVQMMSLPAELVFNGPQIPLHYVFPEAGIYALFLHCAPGGTPRVFDFMVEVVDYQAGMDTHIESIVKAARQHSSPHD